MRWTLSHRFDRTVLPLANRHYNRQTVTSLQFAPPGACLTLTTDDRRVYWISSHQRYALHRWPGAWVCAAFRNEAPERYRSSEMIREAIAATRWAWPVLPVPGMITFVDANKVRPKRDPGRCFRRAGFEPVGYTKVHGHLVLQLLPADFPPPEPALGTQLVLW